MTLTALADTKDLIHFTVNSISKCFLKKDFCAALRLISLDFSLTFKDTSACFHIQIFSLSLLYHFIL